MFKRDQSILIFLALLIYRIPLSRIIGDNGMGYLSGPMEMYICLSMIFGSGLLITMQGMMRERVKRGHFRNAGQVFTIAKRYTFIATIVLLLINIFAYDFISTKLLADGGQRLAYLFVGPALAFNLISSLNKGYLLGTENTPILVLGEFAEIVILGICTIGGSIFGQKYGNKIAALLQHEDVSAMYGAMGAMFGLCVAEFIAMLIFVIFTIIYQKSFRHMMRGDDSRRTEYISDISGRLVSGVLLDGVQNFLIQAPILVIIVAFRKYGISSETENVNSLIGSFYSKYIGLVGILCSLAVYVIPYNIRGIIAAYTDDEIELSKDRLSRLINRVLYFTIPASVFVALLSNLIIDTFFKGMVTSVKTVLPVGSVIILIYALLYIFIGVLIKLNYHKEMLFLSAISLIISIVLSFILVHKQGKGLFAMMLILLISYGVNMILCMLILIRNMRIRFNFVFSFILPLIVASVFGLLLKLLSGALVGFANAYVAFGVCLVLEYFLYNFACMFLRVVNANQMSKKVFGRMFLSIGQNLGIY